MIWVAFALLIAAYYAVFRTPFGLHLRSAGEHPQAAETVSVYRIRYTAVILSGILAGLGGAFLSIGFLNSFSEEMTAAPASSHWPRSSSATGARRAVPRVPALQPLQRHRGSSPRLLRLPRGPVRGAAVRADGTIAVAGVVGRPRPPAAIEIPYERQ